MYNDRNPNNTWWSLQILFDWTMGMGPIGWPETSVRNYRYSPRNYHEERSSLYKYLFRIALFA